MDVIRLTIRRIGGQLKNWVGKPRILKTGLAVFITATICQWLGWPVIFAVIAAIVSIEPSVRTSLQKGKIRLPAAAVGAFFAMLFDFVLGQTPMTYALSAMLTIYVCHLLRWNDAMIVATLTAVNMIAVTESHHLSNFFIRLGTTSVGIIVSVIVNFAIMPPKFSKQIASSSRQLALDCGVMLDRTLRYHMHQEDRFHDLRRECEHLLSRFEQNFRLIEFQKEEFRYRRKRKEWVRLAKHRKKLEMLRELCFRIVAILSLSTSKELLDPRKIDLLDQIRSELNEKFESLFDPDKAKQDTTMTEDSIADKLQELQACTPDQPDNQSCLLCDRLRYELWAIDTLLDQIVGMSKTARSYAES